MTEATGAAEGTGENVGTPAQLPTDQAAEPRQIKPIPESKFLRTKTLGEEAIDSVIEDSKKAAREAKRATYESEDTPTKPADKITRPTEARNAAGRPYNPETGQFVAGSGESTEREPAGEPEPTGEAEPEATEAPAQAPTGKYKFAGREFDSQEAAEKAFGEQNWHFDRAAESANAWKAEAEKLRAELAGKTSSPSPEPSKTEQAATPAAPGIDAEMAQFVYEEAEKAGRPDLYVRWVAEENQRLMREELDRRLGEFAKPQQEAAAQEALKTEILTGWNSLRSYTSPSGSPLFPEIGDPAAERAIGEYWVALGLPPEAMRNPASLMAAIGLYRTMTGTQPAAPSAPRTLPPPPPPTDADAVSPGTSHAPVTDEEEPAEVRWLNNALSRANANTFRIKDANGRSIALFNR